MIIFSLCFLFIETESKAQTSLPEAPTSLSEAQASFAEASTSLAETPISFAEETGPKAPASLSEESTSLSEAPASLAEQAESNAPASLSEESTSLAETPISFAEETGPKAPASLSEILRSEVSFLADSTMNGREFGSAQVQKSIFYTYNTFKRAGLWTSVQSFRSRGKRGHNVIGVTPGFYERYILVCAYFDGLGVVDGKVYPCADSNASGMAALMNLARTLSKSAFEGITGVIFVAFDGHGSDMSGSKYFYDTLSEDYKICLVVNLDTLGSTLVPVRKDRPDYLIALGGQMYDFALTRANRGPALHLTYDYYGSRNFTDLFYKSMGDQKWFVKDKVPAVMFTSGITLNTNKPTDTVESLNYDVLARRVTLIYTWLKNQL